MASFCRRIRISTSLCLSLRLRSRSNWSIIRKNDVTSRTAIPVAYPVMANGLPTDMTPLRQTVEMNPRQLVLEKVRSELPAPAPGGSVLVAVDGVDGSGKSFFADELALLAREAGRTVLRASVDDFHNPREVRYRKGRLSPEGFWLDSYDYERFVNELLLPCKAGAGAMYRRTIHDVHTELVNEAELQAVPDEAMLIVDGIFLHRNELSRYWDFSVWLDVEFENSVARMAERDGTTSDHLDERNQRYIQGQRFYISECNPAARASMVIDNNDLERPRVVIRNNAP